MAPFSTTSVENCEDKAEDKSYELKLYQYFEEVPPFDGEKPDTFFQFQARFEDILAIHDIKSDETKLKLFTRKLRGTALIWYNSYWKDRLAQNIDEPPSFHEVVKAAAQEFGTNDDPYVIWGRLVDNYQEGDVAEYSELYEKYWWEVKNTFESIDQILILQYIRGLRPEIARVVSQRHPTTKSEARRFAMLQEYIQPSSNRKRRQSLEDDHEESTHSSYTKKRKNNDRVWGKGKAEKRDRPPWIKNKRCYNCQKVGHFAKDCRHAGVSVQQLEKCETEEDQLLLNEPTESEKKRIQRLDEVTDIVAFDEKHEHFLCRMADDDSIKGYPLAELLLLKARQTNTNDFWEEQSISNE